MLSFAVGEPDGQSRPSSTTAPGGFTGREGVVFTGDTLFRGSVGGVRAPGHTTYTDLKDSIMGTLMELPPETVIEPGHADPTTVAQEWESNPFIRVWRGLDVEGIGAAARRWGSPRRWCCCAGTTTGATRRGCAGRDGSDDIVPGSQDPAPPEPSLAA